MVTSINKFTFPTPAENQIMLAQTTFGGISQNDLKLAEVSYKGRNVLAWLYNDDKHLAFEDDTTYNGTAAKVWSVEILKSMGYTVNLEF